MIKKDDWVEVSYEGKFEDGKVFDASKEKPLVFKVLGGMIIPGLDEAIVGMKVGEKKTVTINCEKAYGPLSEDIVEIPKEAFGDFDNFVEDTEFQFTSSMGPILIKIVKVKDEGIEAIINHPLAGKTLIFDIEVLKVLSEEEAREQEDKYNQLVEKIKAMHECEDIDCSACDIDCRSDDFDSDDLDFDSDDLDFE